MTMIFIFLEVKAKTFEEELSTSKSLLGSSDHPNNLATLFIQEAYSTSQRKK